MTVKQKLQQSAVAPTIAAMLASENFALASDTALLTFVENLPTATDAQSSMSYHQQLVGAQRYLLTLRTLMTPPKERPVDSRGTLKPIP